MESHGLGLASALLESLRAQRDFKGLPPLLAATAQSHLVGCRSLWYIFVADSPQ